MAKIYKTLGVGETQILYPYGIDKTVKLSATSKVTKNNLTLSVRQEFFWTQLK